MNEGERLQLSFPSKDGDAVPNFAVSYSDSAPTNTEESQSIP